MTYRELELTVKMKVPVRGFHDWLISAQVRVGTGGGRISRILGVPRVPQGPWALGLWAQGPWAQNPKNANYKKDFRLRKKSTDLPDSADRTVSSRRYD